MKIPEYLETPILGVIAILLFGGGITMAYYAFASPQDTKFLIIPYILPDGFNTFQLGFYCVWPILIGGAMILLGMSDIVKRIKKWWYMRNGAHGAE